MIRTGLVGLAMAAMVIGAPARAQGFAGEIVMSGFGICPPGTIAANGALLPIQKEKPGGDDYRELFLLYGTAYGGDGKTSFGLPDMRAQMLAMNNIGRGASAKPADGKAAPAMQVELPIVFCVVIHGSKLGK